MTAANSASDPTARRAELFRESAGERLQRVAFGSLRAVQPNRAGSVALLGRLMISDLLGQAGLPACPTQCPEVA